MIGYGIVYEKQKRDSVDSARNFYSH